MPSILLRRKKELPLISFIPEPVYCVNNIRPRYAYKGGKPTDIIEGYTYTVTNTGTYDQISIVVKQSAPIISEEELAECQERNENTFVEFINARFRPYYSDRTHSIEDSIKADDVEIVLDK